METLNLLGIALGLAALSGINLYLTVFVTGLSIQQGWITLHPQYEQLAVLADPTILWVSGVLFVMEFLADKVPWVDSLWDSVHTVIRPVGGALLAVTALGDANPVHSVTVGLLAGGVSLAAHGAKAGTRLLVNASPEPFSNVAVSLAEDIGVVGGLALVYSHPLIALAVAVVGCAVAVWIIPKVIRAAGVTLWLGWHRVRHALGAGSEPASQLALPADIEIALCRERGENAILKRAAPCVGARGEHLRKSTFGWLLWTGGEEEGLDFVKKSGSRFELVPVPIAGWKALHRCGWICDRVELYEVRGGKKQVFRFDRSRRGLAAAFAGELNGRVRPAALAEVS